jgi:hypothetical protein
MWDVAGLGLSQYAYAKSFHFFNKMAVPRWKGTDMRWKKASCLTFLVGGDL